MKNSNKTKFNPKTNTNSRGKGRKGYKPQRDNNKSYTDSDKSAIPEGNINDASYYFSNPEMLSQVTNISFNEYLGVPLTLDTASVDVTLKENVANITTFYMNPSIQPTGYSDSARYASINVTGFKNYLLLSANNAKTTQYGPQDVTCLILAIGQVLAMYSFLRRPFGCIYLINQRNRSYPELLFKAMGIDYNDFKSNVADYRIKFNELIAMFDRIPFFSEIPYFKKCQEMYSSIYIDEDTPLAQTYMFVPQSTWKIDEAYDPNGTGLETTWVVNKGTTKQFKNYLDTFSDMINALATSTTFNAIFSDVLRVVSNGKGQTLTMEIIAESYAVTPVINQEIRHWINNMKILHPADDKDAFPGTLGVGATNSNDVASLASENGVIYNPIFSVFGSDHSATVASDTRHNRAIAELYENDLVNFDSMAPSVEDRISATRLAVRGQVLKTEAPNPGDYFFTLVNVGLGDYYCSGIRVFDNVVDPLIGIENSWVDIGATGELEFSRIQAWDHLDKLKYAPRIAYIKDDTMNELGAISGDLTYYTNLNFAYMKRLKDVEALTEFAINI